MNTNPKAKAAEQKPEQPKQEATLEAEVEEAAAESEPMGSIAAAVPGNDKAAQDTIENHKSPGAESKEIRDQPKTTAGTEAKLGNEEDR